MTNLPTAPCKPTSLDEAHAALLNILSIEQIEKLKSRPDDVMLYHHGLGTFIRNEWIRHGRLGQLFSAFSPMSVDAMSTLIMESFAAKLCGEPFDFESRAAEASIAERSMMPPDGGNPVTGAEILWVFGGGYKPGAVHTGICPSDGTCWRWVYGTDVIEPATSEEAERLTLRVASWKKMSSGRA